VTTEAGFAEGDDGRAGTAPVDAGDTVGVESGEAGVRAATERLAQLPGLPVAEHVAVFEDVHRLLSGTLADLDAADGGADQTARTGAGQPARPGPVQGQQSGARPLLRPAGMPGDHRPRLGLLPGPGPR
jgi:hypothetical protein